MSIHRTSFCHEIIITEDVTEKYLKYRRIIKTIRNQDDAMLSNDRDKKRALEGRIQHLEKTNPESRKIEQFRNELEQVSRQVKDKERALGDYKRKALYEAFTMRWDALREYAEKSSMLANFGKYLVDLLDRQQQTRCSRAREAEMIVMDCMLAVDGWRLDSNNEQETTCLWDASDDDEDAQALTAAADPIELLRQLEEKYVASLENEMLLAYDGSNGQAGGADEKEQVMPDST